MDDNKFNALLDKYLDGELDDPAERLALRTAITESPERRRRFLRARQLRLAFATLPQAKPRMLFTAPSVVRLRRHGSIFGNAAVFVFALSLAFQKSDLPLQDTLPGVESAAAIIQSVRPASTAPASAGNAPILADDFSANATGSPADWSNVASDAAADLGSLVPVEEYGFVRL